MLQLRQCFGEQLAEKIIQRQEGRQPAEQVRGPHCARELVAKGLKGNQMVTQIGNLKIEHGYYYCPDCQKGFFPLDHPLRLWEKQ